jgi:putative hemolysin
MPAFILTIVLSLAVSFLCSILEACVLSLSHYDIAEISLKRPKLAAILKSFKEDIQKPIAVILIVNTIAHTLGASLSGAQFDRMFGAKWILPYSLAFSFAMIQWTEILPKSLGVQHNRGIANAAARPLSFLVALFTPLVKVVELLNRPFLGKPKEGEGMDITKEISVLSSFASNNSLISKDQEKIITRTVNLAGVKAKDVMVTRPNMRFLNLDMTMLEALVEAHVHNHTRYPLLKAKDSDDVVGYINFKDIVSAMQINPENPSLVGIARPIISVSEDDLYPSVFKKITSSHQHIAVVKDAAGKATGLITLETMMEEIIGELEDEYDVLPSHLYPITLTRFLAGGGALVSSLNETMGLALSDPGMNIAEWAVAHCAAEPRSGSTYEAEGLTLTVKKMSRGRVSEMILEKGGPKP